MVDLDLQLFDCCKGAQCTTYQLLMLFKGTQITSSSAVVALYIQQTDLLSLFKLSNDDDDDHPQRHCHHHHHQLHHHHEFVE